jgi:hypothetical protein
MASTVFKMLRACTMPVVDNVAGFPALAVIPAVAGITALSGVHVIACIIAVAGLLLLVGFLSLCTALYIQNGTLALASF